MSETQTRPRKVTTAELIERIRAAASKPVDRWRGSGRWPVLDACCECGHKRHEDRRVCSLCGATA